MRADSVDGGTYTGVVPEQVGWVLFTESTGSGSAQKWGGYWTVGSAMGRVAVKDGSGKWVPKKDGDGKNIPFKLDDNFGMICAGCGQNVLGKGRALGTFTYML